jgi:hypothetical protein
VAGTPNKVTAACKEIAGQYGPDAIAAMARMAGLVEGEAGAESEQARIAALKEIMDRAYGKAPQGIEGTDGAPIKHVVEILTGVPRGSDGTKA